MRGRPLFALLFAAELVGSDLPQSADFAPTQSARQELAELQTRAGTNLEVCMEGGPVSKIVAAAALPVFIYLLYAPRHAPPAYVTLGTVLISLLVLLKHRSNMERLIAGTENRLKLPD